MMETEVSQELCNSHRAIRTWTSSMPITMVVREWSNTTSWISATSIRDPTWWYVLRSEEWTVLNRARARKGRRMTTYIARDWWPVWLVLVGNPSRPWNMFFETINWDEVALMKTWKLALLPFSGLGGGVTRYDDIYCSQWPSIAHYLYGFLILLLGLQTSGLVRRPTLMIFSASMRKSRGYLSLPFLLSLDLTPLIGLYLFPNIFRMWHVSWLTWTLRMWSYFVSLIQ